MPSPPGSHPSRQLTVRLPWPVWQRLCTLAASDPHGAKPGRVAATAVAAGLEVLEAPVAKMGEAPAREAFQALVAGLEALARGVHDPWRGAYAEALRLARRRASEAVAGVDGKR